MYSGTSLNPGSIERVILRGGSKHEDPDSSSVASTSSPSVVSVFVFYVLIISTVFFLWKNEIRREGGRKYTEIVLSSSFIVSSFHQWTRVRLHLYCRQLHSQIL